MRNACCCSIFLVSLHIQLNYTCFPKKNTVSAEKKFGIFAVLRLNGKLKGVYLFLHVNDNNPLPFSSYRMTSQNFIIFFFPCVHAKKEKRKERRERKRREEKRGFGMRGERSGIFNNEKVTPLSYPRI